MIRSYSPTRRNYLLFAVLSVSTSISGCGTFLANITGNESDRTVSAQPLTITDADVTAAQKEATGSGKLELLAKLVHQSEVSCNQFLDRLVVGENTVNSAGDIVSTALSGMATTMTPLALSHALSGAATVVTGAKSALDSDIYAKAAISDFATAIQQSYYTNIKTYTTALSSLSLADAHKLVVWSEIDKIESYHAMCALAPAESAIKATISSASPSKTPPPAGGGKALVKEPPTSTPPAGVPGSSLSQ